MSVRLKYTSEDIVRLMQDVEQMFGKTILQQRHCDELRTDINLKTTKLLGVTTLRRFFNLIPSSHTPNVSTLDILSIYCGYTSFDLFVKRRVLDTGIKDQLLYGIISGKKIEWDLFIQSLRETQGSPNLYETIQKAILVAISQKEYAIFWKIFGISDLWKIDSYNKRNAYDLVQISAALIATLENKEEIVRNIALQNNGNYFFEWSVDIDNLTTHYGSWLTSYYYPKIHETKDFVFYENLMCLKSFLLQNKKNFLLHYSALTKFGNDELENLHPILQGRSIASSIFYNSFVNKSSNYLKQLILDKFEVVKKLKTFDVGLNEKLFLVFVLQALFLAKNSALLSRIVKELPKNVIDTNDYWTDNVNNHLKIYFSLAYFEMGENKKASQTIEQVQTAKFPRFEEAIQKKAYNEVRSIIKIK